MAIPLYDRLNGPVQPQPQPQLQQSNPMLDRFGNLANFMQVYNTYASGQMGPINPESVVKNMLQNGMLTQDRFNQAAALADQITGRKI